MSSIPGSERSKHASLAGQKRAEREETIQSDLVGGQRATHEETIRASLAGGKQAEREETIRARVKTRNEAEAEIETEAEAEAATPEETGRRPLSPYTVHNLDSAIAHLEIAMNADKSMAIFGSNYWQGRVLELRCTPGILHAQERRLQSLLDGFATPGLASPL
ncbi:hypothetical protein PWP93_29015 [Paraburkholderia sp. A1RI-2L]|uniref:hypothetical protein n=1 Tax=Paraburkholderia sp. A1RI-2L TaxID=3028367 RepID=UPI003B810CCB